MPTSKSSSKSKSRSGSGSPKRSMYRDKSIIELTEGKLTLGKKKELERRQDKLIEKYPIKATEIGLAFDVPKSNTSYDVKNDRVKVKGTFPDDEVYFSNDSVFLPTKINEANLDYINLRATNQEDDFRYEVEKDYDFKIWFDEYGYDKPKVVEMLQTVYPAVDKKLIESVVDKEYKIYQFDKKADAIDDKADKTDKQKFDSENEAKLRSQVYSIGLSELENFDDLFDKQSKELVYADLLMKYPKADEKVLEEVVDKEYRKYKSNK